MTIFVTRKINFHEVQLDELEYICDLNKVINYCKPLNIIGFDFETTGLDPYLSEPLLLILGDVTNQYVIDCSSYTKEELRNVFISIGLEKTYLGQNLKFDYKFAKVHYNIELKFLYDIMIAEQRILQGRDLKFNLPAIVLRRLGIVPIEMNKEVRLEFVNKNVETFVFKTYHITYAAGDIKYLFPIKEKQDERMKVLNQTFLMYNIEFPLISILGNAELVGFKLNENKWEENIKNNKEKRFEYQTLLDEEVRQLRDKLAKPEHLPYLKGGKFDRPRGKEVENFQFDLFGGETEIVKKDDKKAHINYSSTEQLVNILGRLGQPVPTKQGVSIVPTFITSVKGRTKVDKTAYDFTTGEGVIEGYLIELPDSPIYTFIKYLIKYREASTRLNTFGKKFLQKYTNIVTKKVHTIFRQCDAATGRLQSGDTKNNYFNSQNIPADKNYKECFTTDEGRLISTTDLSGAEAVIMIDKAHDEAFYEIAIVNDDAHSPLCQAVWRAIGEYRKTLYTSYEEEYYKANALSNIVISKKENKDLRTAFKPMTFGSIYGMHDKKTAKTLNVSIEEAKIGLKVIKSMIPKTFKMVEANAKFAVTNGYLVLNNRTNSRIWYEKVIDAKRNQSSMTFMDTIEVEGSARNAPIQGTQADMVKEAMVYIDSEIRRQNLDIRLLGQVHDEVIYDFPEKLMENCIEYYDENNNLTMVNAGDFVKLNLCKIANKYLSYIKITAEQHISSTWTK